MHALFEYARTIGGGHGGLRLPSNAGEVIRWALIVLVAYIALRIVLGILGGLFRR